MTDPTLTFHISLSASRKYAGTWGDMPYATSLAQALRAQGAEAQLFFRGERPELTGQGDIVLRILGPTLDDPIAGLGNMVWIISPPNLVVAPVLNRYQKVFVASQRYVDRLASMGVQATNFPQATDPTLFHPSKRPEGAASLPIVFVGAHAERARRPAVTDAIAAGLDVHVWGPGWEGVIPPQNWRGERIDQDELASIYARARVILNAHMPQMSYNGMMSNRSYDGLASGAVVVTDPVQGFSAPDLPDLIQMPPGPEMIDLLRTLLEQPEADFQTRLARHERVAQHHSFAAAATRMIAAAREVLASGAVTPQAFTPRDSGTAPLVTLSPPEASAPMQHDGLVAAAEEIREIFAALEYPDRPPVTPPAPPPAEGQGVLHALMPDLRRAQAMVVNDMPARDVATGDHLDILHRARRVIEGGNSAAPANSYGRDAAVTRLMRGAPLWAHAPDDYDRDRLKQHVVLWPRKAPVRLARPVGVFLHLFYHELGPVFAERLAQLNAPCQVYISTDTAEKADALRHDFPEADIRVMPNRGRDIYPKFYGFADAYEHHDLILHLHGKRSRHSGKLEQWLAHNLECLLPPGDQINRILSLFQSVPQLGLIGPAVFQPVIPAAHWGANREIGEELAWRMGLPADALPENDTLRFPVGSMFWGRREALQPLLDLRLQPAHFPPEAGQTDGTTAHGIERMIGVCCQATGHKMITVAPQGSKLYARYQTSFGSNRELRDALAMEEGSGPEG